MASDLNALLKGEIIRHLSNDGGVTALVPFTRIFGMQMPADVAFPCIRYGAPISAGFEATCWDGMEARVTLHSFAETVPGVSGEDLALQISSAIVQAMKGFAPVSIGVISNEYANTTLLREEREADIFHAATEFNLTVHSI